MSKETIAKGAEGRELRQEWRRDYRILWRLMSLYHTRRNTWNTLLLTANSILLGGVVIGSRLGAADLGQTSPPAFGWVMLLVSLAGVGVCILWYLINRRLDVQDHLRWAQLNELERRLGKNGVLISTHARSFFREAEDGIPAYLSEMKMHWDQRVGVKHAVLGLAAIFLVAHVIIFCWAFCNLLSAEDLAQLLGSV